jgi:hypothetical protein
LACTASFDNLVDVRSSLSTTGVRSSESWPRGIGTGWLGPFLCWAVRSWWSTKKGTGNIQQNHHHDYHHHRRAGGLAGSGGAMMRRGLIIAALVDYFISAAWIVVLDVALVDDNDDWRS